MCVARAKAAFFGAASTKWLRVGGHVGLVLEEAELLIQRPDQMSVSFDFWAALAESSRACSRLLLVHEFLLV